MTPTALRDNLRRQLNGIIALTCPNSPHADDWAFIARRLRRTLAIYERAAASVQREQEGERRKRELAKAI